MGFNEYNKYLSMQWLKFRIVYVIIEFGIPNLSLLYYCIAEISKTSVTKVFVYKIPFEFVGVLWDSQRLFVVKKILILALKLAGVQN